MVNKLLITGYKTLFLTILVLSATLKLTGANRYSVATGNWSSTASWSATSGGGSGASVPVAGDIVYIEGGRTITITANAACASVSVASGSTLTVGGFNLAVTGTTTVSGTIIHTSTSGTKTMGNVVISGGVWTSNAAETFAITTLTLSGSTFNGTATGIFNVSTSLSVTVATTNTFNASTITVTGTTLVDGNLIFASSTGTKTFTGLVTINAGDTWNNSGNSAFNFRGGITNNGTFTAGTGLHTFSTNAQALNGTLSIPSVTITGVTVTNNGNLTITTALAGTGRLTNAATGQLHLNFTGAVGINTITATAAGNTVDYGFAGTQTIKAVTYSNLAISGSGTKTLAAATTVGGNLTISGTSVSNTATLNPSTYNFSVTGTTTINDWGIFNDNNNTGINTFTGVLTLNNSATWNTLSVTTPSNLVFKGGISHNGTVDFAGYAATFTGAQDLLLTSSGDITFNTGASLVNSVAVNNNLNLQCTGTGIFQFWGAGNFTINAGVTVYNQGTVDFQQVLIGVNATTSAWLNDDNSTLSYQNSTGPLATGVLTASASGNTIDYDGNGAQVVKNASYYNLTLSNTRSSNAITIGAISVAGSFTRTATFTGGTGIGANSVTYNGPSSQTVLSTDSYFVYNNLIINNSSGVALNNNTTVSGTLTFTNGIISTGANSLVLLNSATLTGAGTGKYVNGNLKKGIAASTASKTFEIGDDNYYTPVTLGFTGTTNGTGTITAATTAGNHPNINTSILNPVLSVNRYWTLTNSGVSGFSSYNATFSFDVADVDTGADWSNFVIGNYVSSAWINPTTGSTTSASTQATGLNTFGDFQIGEPTSSTIACLYGDNGSTPAVSNVIPCINIPSNPQTVSATLAAHQYFTLNVIRGLTYQVYTCNTTSPANPLKMVVYKEGAISDPYIAFSNSNTGNPCTSVSNNVYVSFTPDFSGQVRVLINRKSDCSTATPSGLTVMANVSSGSNLQDSETAAGSGSWIGHIYEGTNSGVAYNDNFLNYLGYYTETETFNESFGGSTNCFSPVTSNGTTRATLYTEMYSVRYRMNSTKRGLYVADLGTDDGGRLTVDGNLIYNNWVDQGFVSYPRVLMNLNGASSLVYDFYENSGANQAAFQNLTLIIANTLAANTTQNICMGNTGLAISGDVYGTLPSGITLSGTGYQWTYSTSPAGARTNIPGATGATYTPNTSVAPFNVAGTYYVYRNVILSSNNNVSPNPYVATNESGAATITVTTLPVATFSYTGTPYCSNATNPSPTFSGGGVAGTFSSTAGLVFVNTATGQVNLAASTAGTYTVTNTIAASGGCGIVTSTSQITITSLPVATFNYTGSPYCLNASNPSPTFSVGGVGGIFSSTSGLVFVSTATGQINLTASTPSTYTVTNTVAASGPCSQVIATASITINPVLPVSISVAPSMNPVCSGTSVTFTATPANGGTTPAYQWKVNGTNAGTNSSSYSYSPLNNDAVTCVLTSNAACSTGSPAISNTVTMTVNPNLPASVSISATATTICSGTSVTFTATPVNGGSSPSYQWKLNGTNVGTNSNTYTNAALANGNSVICVMTSNATPCSTGSPATSNTITMTVNPNLPVSVSIAAAANPFCSGTAVTFTASPVNGGTTPIYQWMVNGGNVGTNNTTYTYSPANNDAVTCILTSNAICAQANPATSNTVTMVASTVPTVTTTTPASRCGTGTLSLGATASAGILNWYSTSTGGSSSGSGTLFVTPSLSTTTTYYVDATLNGCTTDSRSPVLATVNAIPAITGTTPNSHCEAGSVILGAIASAGTINWYSASTGGTSLETGTSFTTPDLSATTVYYVDATATGCTTGSRSPVTATINAIPAITGTTPVGRCGSGTVSLSATTSAGTTNWYDSSTGGSLLGSGATFTTPGLSGSTTYYVGATDGACSSAARIPVIATIIPAASITAGGGGTFCSGSNISLTSSGTNITNQYWTGPNNYYSVSQNPDLNNSTTAMSGIYTVTGSAVSDNNLVSNGDFESGHTGFASAYTHALPGPNGLQNEGTYDIISNPQSEHTSFSACGDHTTGSGLQMVVNGSTTTDVSVWAQTANVMANTDYRFTYWVQSVFAGNPSQLQLYVNGVAVGPVYTCLTETCQWTQFIYNWNSGPGTTANLSLVNKNSNANGNDFALDDIIFQQACSATSTVSLTINSTVVNGGNVTGGTTICSGSTSGLLSLSGYSGTIVKWQSSVSPFSTWTDIVRTVSTYSPGVLTQTTRFRAVIHSGTCANANSTYTTVTVTPNVGIPGPPTPSSSTICQGSANTVYTTSATNATSYNWTVSGAGNTISGTGTTGTVTWAAGFSGIATINVTANGCNGPSSPTSGTVTVTPAVGTPVFALGATSNRCQGAGQISYTATATNSTGITYSLDAASISAGNSIIAATGAVTYVANWSGTSTVTATASGCIGPSTATHVVTTNPNLPVSILIGASANNIGLGTSVNFTATPTNGGTSPVYQWKVNGVNAGTNSSIYSYAPVNNDVVSCLLTSNATCVSGNPSISNYITMIVFSSVGNNIIDFVNGSHGVICATADENTSAVLTAPEGAVFISVGFASYGTPDGTCSAFTIGGCNASTSQSVSEGYILGNNTASIPATNGVFSDPCQGTVKRLYVMATYTMPICSGNSPGTLTGTLPTGGNGVFTYLWESSTAGPSSGFNPASGTNNLRDYTPGVLSQSTWYRRTVTSGGISDVSKVILIRVNPLISGNAVNSPQSICSGSSPSALSGTVPTGGNGTYVYLWESSTTSASSGFVTASGSNNVQGYAPGVLTQTTWYRRAVTSGGCSNTSAAIQVTVTPLPSATISYPGSPYCFNTGLVSVSRTGTAGGSYSSLPSGLTLNSATGEINTTTSSQGIYTITYTIAAAGGCNIFTTSTPASIIRDLVWTGSVSSNWNVPGNWSCGAIPDLTTNIQIPNVTNKPVLSNGAAGTVKNIIIDNASSLTISGNTMQIAGTITNNGTFTATSGTIEMKGSVAQTIGANVFAGNTILNFTNNNSAGVTLQGPLNITGIVKASSGNLSSGGNLTLISTASQTALVDGSGSGNITGNVSMQRYLPSAFGYKYFSSPFQAATVAEFAEDMDLNTPFPSFYRYDENHLSLSGTDLSGWAVYTSPGGILNPLEGYAVNFGSALPAKTADITGVVNNGPLSISLMNHNRTYTKGFSLVGNPYPSPIDWNVAGWTKTNIDNALYFFNAGSSDQYTGVYSSYVNGVSTGNANNIIASMQGFFVHVTNGTYPVSATLGTTNSIRINDLNPLFKDAIFDNRTILRFTANFDTKNSAGDAAVIYFEDHAKQYFEKDIDALKMTNTDLLVPNLYTLSKESKQLSINGMSLPSDSITYIPLGITTLTDGWINFKAEDIRQLASSIHLYLVDDEKGITQDLKRLSQYRFYLKAGVYDQRFKLVFSLAAINSSSVLTESLFAITRSANNILVKLELSSNSTGNLIVTNMKGQILLRREVSGQETVELSPAVSSGVYIVTVISGNKKASEKILIRTDYE